MPPGSILYRLTVRYDAAFTSAWRYILNYCSCLCEAQLRRTISKFALATDHNIGHYRIEVKYHVHLSTLIRICTSLVSWAQLITSVHCNQARLVASYQLLVVLWVCLNLTRCILKLSLPRQVLCSWIVGHAFMSFSHSWQESVDVHICTLYQ